MQIYSQRVFITLKHSWSIVNDHVILKAENLQNFPIMLSCSKYFDYNIFALQKLSREHCRDFKYLLLNCFLSSILDEVTSINQYVPGHQKQLTQQCSNSFC